MILKPIRVLSLSALLLLASPVLQAQVYSWTDAQGRKHYGDASSAPASAKSIDVRVSQPSTSPSPTTTATAATAATAAAASEAAKPNPDKEACEQSIRNRDLLSDQSKQVMKAGENGAVEMNADDRAQALDRAQQQVKMFCKS